MRPRGWIDDSWHFYAWRVSSDSFGDPFVVLVPALDPVKRHVAIYRKKPHDLVRPAGCIDRTGLLQTNETHLRSHGEVQVKGVVLG
jgi:hypothetical protein